MAIKRVKILKYNQNHLKIFQYQVKERNNKLWLQQILYQSKRYSKYAFSQ